MYRIFDRALSCDFPLPELPRCVAAQADLRVRLAGAQPPDLAGFELAFEWLNPQGGEICRCERRGADFLFVFPGACRFLIEAGGAITCLPEPGCDERLLRHFLLNQVVPRWLGQQGRMVVHASAVRLSGGQVVIFLGDSGRGKSTLAAWFHAQGCELLSDDAVILECRDEGVWMIPAYSSMRLWRDSLEAVVPGQPGFAALAAHSDKLHWFAVPSRQPGADNCWPLAAIFLLGAAEGSDRISIAAAGGQDAAMSIIPALFNLDARSPALLGRNLRWVGRLLAQDVAVFNLDYPRAFDSLPAVAAAICRAVAEPGPV